MKFAFNFITALIYLFCSVAELKEWWILDYPRVEEVTETEALMQFLLPFIVFLVVLRDSLPTKSNP